ncbi:DUF3219 family protein [Bacillus sp. ISL-45]|uniref:DUF3219 family protein n=1 Tax=Bacillus sp. ISL-45 TaxID=2819128 RepID=UPI001BE75D32|nr:DUF3219 family protein [Bacillus sp. ISL-45]MBT2661180.1 DUF3219 family protein [Bacillus sp. ISL-45]
MGDRIVLDGHPILVKSLEMGNQGGLKRIAVEFSVTSEDYHDVTTLLYKGEFDVQVPARDAAFRGKIVEYSTSVTNLYKSGQVGTFKLALLEIKE